MTSGHCYSGSALGLKFWSLKLWASNIGMLPSEGSTLVNYGPQISECSQMRYQPLPKFMLNYK